MITGRPPASSPRVITTRGDYLFLGSYRLELEAGVLVGDGVGVALAAGLGVGVAEAL